MLKKQAKLYQVIDSGLLMGIHVYVKHHLDVGTMTQAEWELFSRVMQHSVEDRLIYPDIVIFAQCDIQFCLERIKQRGRKAELAHTERYLSVLQKRLEELKAHLLAKGVKVLEINTAKNDYRNTTSMKPIIKKIEKLLAL